MQEFSDATKMQKLQLVAKEMDDLLNHHQAKQEIIPTVTLAFTFDDGDKPATKHEQVARMQAVVKDIGEVLTKHQARMEPVVKNEVKITFFSDEQWRTHIAAKRGLLKKATPDDHGTAA